MLLITLFVWDEGPTIQVLWLRWIIGFAWIIRNLSFWITNTLDKLDFLFRPFRWSWLLLFYLIFYAWLSLQNFEGVMKGYRVILYLYRDFLKPMSLLGFILVFVGWRYRLHRGFTEMFHLGSSWGSLYGRKDLT